MTQLLLTDIELLKELYINQRLDIPVIAKQLKVGKNTVVRALERYNIKKEQRFPKFFTPEQQSVLYGGMFGDANLSIQKNGINACLRMEQSIKQIEYLKYKFEYFRPWLNNVEPTLQMQKQFNGVSIPSVIFTTVSVPLFTEVYYQFYKDGKKVVTKETLSKIDALALGIWCQDDMSYSYNSTNGGSIMRLHTQGFTYPEQELICNYFREKWDINPKITPSKMRGKLYYYLRFLVADAKKLVEIIRPHVIPSMAYKLDPHLKSNGEIIPSKIGKRAAKKLAKLNQN